jgi:hypothetical protein
VLSQPSTLKGLSKAIAMKLYGYHEALGLKSSLYYPVNESNMDSRGFAESIGGTGRLMHQVYDKLLHRRCQKETTSKYDSEKRINQSDYQPNCSQHPDANSNKISQEFTLQPLRDICRVMSQTWLLVLPDKQKGAMGLILKSISFPECFRAEILFILEVHLKVTIKGCLT